jgi:TorA maturation chaperone TorD
VRPSGVADVAGFYRAFGVEPISASERPDHISAELEFMQLLAAKEAVALGDEGEGERAAVCREAARAFLRDHLGRFVERFADAVEAGTREPFYLAAARLLAGFVTHDAARLGVEWAPTPPSHPRRSG